MNNERKFNHSLSIVIPFYNEKEYLPVSIPLINRCVQLLEIPYEIILINDGSIDGSLALAQSISLNYPNIKIFSLSHNQGLGSAIRLGFCMAKNDFILYTDMDLPFDFSQNLGPILEAAKDFDLCYGIRTNKKLIDKRRIYRYCFNGLMKIIFGTKNPDINFAMKVIRRSELNKFILRSNGSLIDAEIFLKMTKNNCSIKSIPILYQERIYGKSHLDNWNNILKIVIELIRIYPELKFKK